MQWAASGEILGLILGDGAGTRLGRLSRSQNHPSAFTSGTEKSEEEEPQSAVSHSSTVIGPLTLGLGARIQGQLRGQESRGWRGHHPAGSGGQGWRLLPALGLLLGVGGGSCPGHAERLLPNPVFLGWCQRVVDEGRIQESKTQTPVLTHTTPTPAPPEALLRKAFVLCPDL